MNTLKEILTNLQCEFVAERNLVNPDDISWLQYDILSALSSHNYLLPSELSMLLGVSRVKLAKALKGLKQQNYILQKRSLTDGRELQTQITQKGLETLAAIYKGHEDLATVIKQIMTEKEQLVFSELADRLSKALQQRRLEHAKRNSNH